MLYNKISVEFLILPNGKVPIEKFFSQLDEESLAKIYRLIGWLEKDGYLTYPRAKKLENYKGLWEMRIQSSHKALRIFYIYDASKIILISGFIKKSQKTPKKELSRVKRYLKQMEIIP